MRKKGVGEEQHGRLFSATRAGRQDDNVIASSAGNTIARCFCQRGRRRLLEIANTLGGVRRNPRGNCIGEEVYVQEYFYILSWLVLFFSTSIDQVKRIFAMLDPEIFF